MNEAADACPLLSIKRTSSVVRKSYAMKPLRILRACAVCRPVEAFSKEASMHPFAGRWAFGAMVALAAVAVIALIG